MRGRRLSIRVIGLAAYAAALTFGPSERAGADALSDGRFRNEIVSLMRTTRPGATIALDPDPAKILVGPRTIDLTNLHGHLRDLPAPERRKAIETFLATALPSAQDAQCCRSTAYDAVKARLRVQLLPREVIGDHPEFVQRPFSETLNVVYVLDEPKRYRYVTGDMLAGWGVDRALVEAVAVKNLAAASGDVPAQLVVDKDRPAYLISQAGDDYDAARLLVPSFLAGLRKSLNADAIVLAVPTRNLVMAWPFDAKKRAVLAASVTQMMKAGPYGRSDELFRFDASGLRPLNATERADHGR